MTRAAPLIPLTVDPAPTTAFLLEEAARRWPERVAVDFLGAATTYAQLATQVAAAAQVLRDLGVGRGDRVALVLPNCPQHVVAFYAVTSLGATVAEHNPLAAPEEIRGQLRLHGASVVVAWEHAVATVLPEEGQERTVLAVDLTAAMPRRTRLLLRLPLTAARAQRAKLRASVPEGVGSWDQRVAAAVTSLDGRNDPSPTPGEGAAARHTLGPSPEDVAVLLPTGGTTGTPKLVPLTHTNLMANVAQGRQWVPGLREGATDPPQERMATLFGSGHFERGDLHALRIQEPDDVPHDAALAGRVHALHEEQHAASALAPALGLGV